MSVGLSFGSATSGTGFDVSTTVTEIMASESAIETPWKTQLTALTAQDTVLSTLGTDLSTLTTDMQTLTDFNSVLSQKQGSSSDTSILALTSADSTATAGSHTVVVSSLAQTASDYSDVISSTSDTLSGSITIQVGSGTSQTIAVGSSSNTLSTLASAINSAGAGVTASVITDTSGSRLSIVSGTGGSAGQLTITSNLTDTSNSNTSINFNTGQTGSNGSITVDGVSMSISSNTVSTAIPGVTFQLLSASAGTSVQVQITNDTSAVESALSSVVTAYNTVVKDLKTQEGKDSSGNAEPLYGSPTIALIQQQLSHALLTGAASGSISSVTQLGLESNQDGTLSLNSDTLSSVLNSSFSDVVGYLQNSGSFGKTFLTTLNNLGTTAPDGAIYLAEQQNSAQESALNASITAEDARITADTSNLTTELNTANEELQSIPSQLNEIKELYSAITGYNSTSS